MSVRKAAVAGTWYPGSAGALTREVDAYLDAADIHLAGTVHAIIAPHAGLMFSGPVGAWSYKVVARGDYDVAFVVGPSHFIGFEGFSVWVDGPFETPLGDARIDAEGVAAMLRAPLAQDLASAHTREHSLEMQLPFMRRLLPEVPIVPVVIGYQTREAIEALSQALVSAAASRRALLVASTDLSHYFDATTAVTLDARVLDFADRFDPEGLLAWFEQYPEGDRGRYVGCGGGAAIAIMFAARALGARDGRVLKYANSGDVSGDRSAVVGYLSAAFGTFDDAQ